MYHVFDHPSPSKFLLDLGGGADCVFSKQLSGEVQLQRICEDLLHSYKGTKNWQSASEVAQALGSNSARIVKLKQQIESIKISKTLPYLVALQEPSVYSFPGAAYKKNSVIDNEVRDESNLEEDESIQLVGVSPTASASRIADDSEAKDLDNTEENSPLLELAHKDHCNYLVEVKKYDLMESLDDRFEDLSKESSHEQSLLSMGAEQHEVSGEIQASKANAGDTTKLEIPIDDIMYASSESSGQFCSPQANLDTGASEEDEEESQYVDALSELDMFPAAWENHQSSADGSKESTNILTVSRITVGNDQEVYSITLNRDTSLCLAKTVLDPVMRSRTEIVQLRDRLSSTFNDSLATQFPFHSDLENRNEDKDISRDLERFLNQVACSPVMCEAAIFIKFLNSDCQEAISDSRSAPCPMIQDSRFISTSAPLVNTDKVSGGFEADQYSEADELALCQLVVEKAGTDKGCCSTEHVSEHEQAIPVNKMTIPPALLDSEQVLETNLEPVSMDKPVLVPAQGGKDILPELVVVEESTSNYCPVEKSLSHEHLPTSTQSSLEMKKSEVPEPVQKEPLSVPESVSKEPSPVPKPVEKEPSPLTESFEKTASPVPESVQKEPSPVPESVQKEPSPVPESVQKEPSPVPESVQKEPSPVPESVHEEPSPVPESVQKEPSPVPESVQKELSSVPKSVEMISSSESAEIEPAEKEPPLVPEPVGKEPSPLPESVEKKPSPEPELVEKEPSPVPRLVDKEPVPESVEKEPSPVPKPVPESVEKKQSPEPELVEKEPSPVPKPVDKEPSPEPELVEKEPSPVPKPVDKEPSPEPELVEKVPSSVPKPVDKEPSPEPELVEKEPSPVPKPVDKEPPELVEKEPSPVLKLVDKEPSPVPNQVEKEPSPIPESVQKEPSPVPGSVEKELSPMPKPVEKELSPLTESVMKEPSPVPGSVQEEPSSVPESVEKEPSLVPEPVEKEPSPVVESIEKALLPLTVSVEKEPLLVPELLEKEPSPVPKSVAKEPSPPADTKPSVVPELIETESSPVPEPVERESSPVSEPVEKEPSPVPEPIEREPSPVPEPVERVPSPLPESSLPMTSKQMKEEEEIKKEEANNYHKSVSFLSIGPSSCLQDGSTFGVLGVTQSEEQLESVTDDTSMPAPSDSNGLLASPPTSSNAGIVCPPHNVGDVGVLSPSHSNHTRESTTTLTAVEINNSSSSDGAGTAGSCDASTIEEDSIQDDNTNESHILERKKSKSVKSLLLQGKKSIKKHNWLKTKHEDYAAPSLMRPMMTQDWDATCLLEELYMDFRPSTRGAALSGEMARYYGYLEKLPKNATKASMVKGWKRRYFRLIDDKAYYYEDRTTTKALGFVRLSTSRINLFPEKNQIQIQEKRGPSIMLKARDKEDASGWYRAFLLEAAHPTIVMPDPTSPLPDKEAAHVFIIDIGAASVRAGFSGSNAYPEMFFPAVASIDSTNYDSIGSGTTALLPNNRNGAYQVYPRKEQLRMDRIDKHSLILRAVGCIIDSVISDLDVDPEITELILTFPPTIPEQQKKELVELLFEEFKFSAICFQDQTLLSLYSYNTTSGIVVNVGDHIDVIPIIDGYTIKAGVSRLPHGGNSITENLSKLIAMKGLRYFSETEMYIVRLIKEELCYISQSYDEDLARCEEMPAAFTRATDLDRFQLPDHRKVVALDLECFKAPEGLFQPRLWGKDVPGLHELVWKAIQACPIDHRKEMARHIYLSGSTTLLPYFQERLQKEVYALATTGLTVEVHAGPSRQHATFLGASVLATLGSFQNYLITREEFNSSGFDVLSKWSTV